ncbi:MAG TPA: DsbA family protein [Verrucomicrobiae bacterium]|jgi:predicted DsbA family dithiol-disulfide isomerase|nr:DsbA family protein [Verrucomicrobiae bacterium]
MSVKVTYYLDVISSWCLWAEPAWLELKLRYAKAPVEFTWAIGLIDESGMSKSQAQADWFYRRSGTIMRSPFMLNSGWMSGLKEYLAPNCMLEAARGANDDRVRLAMMEAAMREGRKVGDWQIAAAVAAKAAKLKPAALLKKAKSPEIEKRVRKSTAEFHAFQMTQRPAFLLDNNIGDRAVFSGLAKAGPIAAAIDAMLQDSAAYAAHAAHFGTPPKN